LDSGDYVSFFGSMLGAAITVWGSIWVINYQARKKITRDKSILLSFLAIMETRLQWARDEPSIQQFLQARDVPGFINRCALIIEMQELLNSDAVAEAAEGYDQLYTLHRLKRAMRVWAHAFEPYADIPYTDFYKLASVQQFETAVDSVIVPTNIVRASLHLYVATITGQNMVLDEITRQNDGEIPVWNPDQPYVPEV
jgi:hypothetical protein